MKNRASLACAAVAVGLLGCAAPARAPDPPLAALWRDYLELPDERALAVAGDPTRIRWVAGASGGHATRSEAEEAALGECAVRRLRQRIEDPCLLYATGEEIVWPER